MRKSNNWARTDRQAASTERSPRDRIECRSARTSEELLGQLHQLIPELLERHVVRLPSGPDQEVQIPRVGVQPRQHLESPDLTQSASQPVAIHDRVAVLWHDRPEACTGCGGSREEDVEFGRPPPLSPPQQATDLARAPNSSHGREAYFGWRPRLGGCADYFEPTSTTSRRRPFLRRLDSVLRPARVLIRARNPWVFFLFRFRGLYVGFMRNGREGNHPHPVGPCVPAVRRTRDGRGTYRKSARAVNPAAPRHPRANTVARGRRPAIAD